MAKVGMKWGAAIIFVALGATEARAEPAWCASSQKGAGGGGSVQDALKQDAKSFAFIFPALVEQTCHPDAEGKARAKELADARAYWSKRFDMTEDDWADMADWVTQDQGSRQSHGDVRRKDRNQAWSALSPIGQYVVASNYTTDALDSKLTETGRLGYIWNCADGRERDRIVQFAMCQGDIDVFDRTKIAAELRSDHDYSGTDKMSIRLLLDDLDAKLKARDADIKQWIAHDDAYQKVFEVAAQARKEWAKIDPALVAVTLAMDDARITQSRKATAGCSEKIWPLFKAAVSKIPAAEFADAKSDPGIKLITRDLVQTIVSHPDGFLASIALVTCEADHATNLHSEIAMKTQRWPGFRGPRTMAESMIAEAGIVLDDKNASLDFPGANHEWKVSKTKIRDKGRGYGRGVIAKVKPGTDTMHYEFAKASAKQVECTSYKQGHRIIGFDTAGNPTYDGACLAYKTVTLDATFPPFDPDKRYTTGLKVGMVIEPDGDMVAAAWTKNGDKRPSYVFGAPVK